MMKLISLVLLLTVSGVAKADTYVANTAKNQRGAEVSADYGGYDATRVYATTEVVLCTGRCVLAGLLASTGNNNTSIRVYDTSVAGALDAAELKLISSFDASQTGSAGNRVPRPLRFNKGISVKLSSIAAGESVTVLFVDLDAR